MCALIRYLILFSVFVCFFLSLELPLIVGSEMGLYFLVLRTASCIIISLHRISELERECYLAQVSLEALMGGTEQRSDRETVCVLFVPDLRLFHQRV